MCAALGFQTAVSVVEQLGGTVRQDTASVNLESTEGGLIVTNVTTKEKANAAQNTIEK